MNKKVIPNIGGITRKLPLEKFIPAAFLIFLLFFIILSIITYQNIGDYLENRAWVSHVQDVINTTERVNNFIFEIPSACRSYILTNDDRYVKYFEENQNKISSELNELKKMFSDNPLQRRRVEMLDSLSAGMIAALRGSIELYRKEHEATPEQSKFAAVTEDYLKEIKKVVSEIKNEENNILAAKSTSLEATSKNIQYIIIVSSLIAFIAVGL